MPEQPTAVRQFEPLPSYLKNRPRTRIVCTIGPATGDTRQIVRLIRAGMSVARLNLSHGSSEEHASYIANVRQASEQARVPVGILADLPGPKYRVGRVAAASAETRDGRRGVWLERGSRFTLTAAHAETTAERGMVWPAGLYRDIKPRARVLIDEGAVELVVDEIRGDEIRCTVRRSGLVQNDKAVTAPGNVSTLNYLTRETSDALDFALSADVDFIGLSYIRDTGDLMLVRERMEAAGKSRGLISKIEIQQAVANLEQILAASDAIMVARGDLGVEMPLHQVPMVQKRMIRLANEAGKPVITATQMLESMRDNPYPTRAESTDVYNAVRDGTDAVMLSAETSVGSYPIAAVRFMARVSRTAERFLEVDRLRERRMSIVERQGRSNAVDSIIAYDAAVTADRLRSGAIVTFTESGDTAASVASFRPRTPLLALSPHPRTANRLAINWGITSVLAEPLAELNELFRYSSELTMAQGYAKAGDSIVMVAGLPIGQSGSTNLLRVIKVPEQGDPDSAG